MSSIVDSRRTTRLPPMNSRFLDDSSDDESEDEETRLQREEEQERLLSEQHGEAEEASERTTNTKRNKEDDIEAEYASAARKKARRRPTLTPAMLTGSSGLVRIKSEFPRTVKWPKQRTSTAAASATAALYSRSLVDAYKSFSHDLFPNSAFQDVLTRIESFGSKKEVKDYLQHMRQDVRNAHLERVYGKDKAASLIEELEHGLEQQRQQQQGLMDDDLEVMQQQEQQAPLTRGPVRGPETRSSSHGDRDTTAPETSGGITTTTTASTMASAVQDVERQQQRAASAIQDDDLQDTDDELEFVAPLTNKPVVANPFNENDDDEDDNEFAKDKEKTLLSVEKEGGKDAPSILNAEKVNKAEARVFFNEEQQEKGSSHEAVNECEGNVDIDVYRVEKQPTNNLLEPLLDETTSLPSRDAGSLTGREVATTSPDVGKFMQTSLPEESQEVASPTREPEAPKEMAIDRPALSATQIDDDVPTQEPIDSQETTTGNLAQESLSISTQENAAQLSPEETATIVPTMSTMATQDGESSQQDPTAPQDETSSTTSQEAATVVASMETLVESASSDEADAA